MDLHFTANVAKVWWLDVAVLQCEAEPIHQFECNFSTFILKGSDLLIYLASVLTLRNWKIKIMLKSLYPQRPQLGG